MQQLGVDDVPSGNALTDHDHGVSAGLRRHQVDRWPKRRSGQSDHFEILSAAATKAVAH
jgi:hypothetical protein